MPEADPILLVEDDQATRRSIAKLVTKLSGLDCIAADTLEQARHHVDSAEWTAAICDLRLPDGSGLEFIEELREHRPLLPVMAHTGVVAADVANRLQRCRAEYVVKPANPDNLGAFLEDALWVQRVGRRHLGRCLASYARRFELSDRERDVLNFAVRGVKRDRMAARFGTTTTTVKSQIRSLLQKTGHDNLASVAREVLAEAWHLTPSDEAPR